MIKLNKNSIFLLLTFIVFILPSCSRTDYVTIIGKEKQFKFHVELAKTQEEREKGLMFRSSLKHDTGMLFIFENPRTLTFWMKNTYIPLTVLFINEDNTIIDIYDMYPLIDKIYASSKPCKYALEINQKIVDGSVKPGDKVKIVINDKRSSIR